jgi:hypothetical protein
LLTVYSAPDFAEGANRASSARPGTWKPDPAAYADFATALATRYSGGFAGLPRIRYFQAWNEPNLFVYLNPQYDGANQQAAGIYKALLNAFYAAVKAVHADNRVVTAGTAPYGDPPGGIRTRPMTFWRAVFCRGGAGRARRGGCPDAARFDLLAHHPINTTGGPTKGAIDPNDISTPDVKRLRRLLRNAEKRGDVRGAGRHAIWATEIWWDTQPPAQKGVSPARQARWLEQAMYVLWKQGVSAMVNLQLQDAPTASGRLSSTGIYFADGQPKRSRQAFSFPFVADRTAYGRLTVWGKAPVAGKLAIQRRAGSHWRLVESMKVRAGQVFHDQLDLHGAPTLRAVVGGEHSLPWRQG